MPQRTRSRSTTRLLVSLALLSVVACGGGGSGSTDFELVSVSVPDNGVWQINRPILFEFSDDVDFSTVNLNTIQIAQTSGIPAAGEFSLVDPHTVSFQPRCPTVNDYSDAGLAPGGVSYTIKVLASTQGGPTLRSLSGEPLLESQTLHFTTPASNDPAVLFLDAGLGPPAPVIDPSAGSYIEVGGSSTNTVHFVDRVPPAPDLGADTPSGFTAGLNLYSDVSSHIAVVVAINQAVDSSNANINVDTVRMEYLTGAGTWEGIAHTVDLLANCRGTGALVRATPSGILPQNHVVRVLLTPDFRDIAGDSNLVSVTVGSFLVTTATDPTPPPAPPGLEGDELLEEFSTAAPSPDSLEDASTPLGEPRATWGKQGTLEAGFAFGGTGGPNGDFDWKVGLNGPPLTTTFLDTTFAVITNQQQTATQTVINGVVDIRNLTITEFGTLVIQGPNPCTILVSGSAQINGEITVDGTSNLSVHTLNTTNQPEPGATGRAGGGKGGAGNPLTTQSSPSGEAGYGAFNVAGGGGRPGESGFQPSFPADLTDEHRRPAGGGGGTFGEDYLRPKHFSPDVTYENPDRCADQGKIGYDAEKGRDGYPGQINPPAATAATGVLTGARPPQGGDPGPRPFFDNDPTNDFWGTMRALSGQVIQGELSGRWAGAGGGGGGNAICSNSFPTTPFDCCGFLSDEKGSGGGGGGGSITILALGNITFGPSGRIQANGGTGGGGENSLAGGTTHIGGGSGGGSGGHIVLQTASQIDLSAVRSTLSPPGGLYALGGEGGAGADDLGGARPEGIPLPPNADSLSPPLLYYPNTTAPCGIQTGTAGYTFSNNVGAVICAGGDGGPGIIQLHTPTLADIILPPTGQEVLYNICRPTPVGSYVGGEVPDFDIVNDPLGTTTQRPWDQLLPIFGRKSQALSKWISLGAASVSPTVSQTAPELVDLTFGGTDAVGPTATGKILTTGSGQSAVVAELAPVFSGTLAAASTMPYIAVDLRTLVVDGTTLTDDIYIRNPALLRRFRIRLTATGQPPRDFEVGFSSYDPITHELRMTVSDSGATPLAGFAVGSAVEIIPRFFSVSTEGTQDSLPASSEIKVEFQATLPNAQGDPDENAGVPSPWVTDINRIEPNSSLPHIDYRFIRFRVTFDISAAGAPLTFDTPIPSLDFFRVPFKF